MAKTKTKTKVRKLDFKQQRFCEEYIIDWNGNKAAIRAGYSPRSARAQASTLLTKPNIQAYIQTCKLKIEQLAGVSKLKALKKLGQIAFTDLTDAFNDDGSLKQIKEMNKDVKACISGIETTTMDDVAVTKIKTESQRGAIQDMAKMLGWNEPDKVEHSGDINIEI